METRRGLSPRIVIYENKPHTWQNTHNTRHLKSGATAHGPRAASRRRLGGGSVDARPRLGGGSAAARLVLGWAKLLGSARLIPGLGSTATRLRRSCSSARLFVVRLRLSSAAHEAWLRFGYGRSVAPHARLQRARASANERDLLCSTSPPIE